MDVGRDIDKDNRPATKPERMFVWSEISLGVALSVAVIVLLTLAALYVLVGIVAGVIAG